MRLSTFVVGLSVLGFGLGWMGGGALAQERALTQAKPVPVTSSLRWSIIKTADTESLDGLVRSGGDFFALRPIHHAAFLIEHGSQHFLFDTGLGERIDQQFSREMPWYLQGLFQYQYQASVKAQLPADYAVDFMVLSHVHWDHGGGLLDYPRIPVWIDQGEFQELEHRDNGRTFAAQFEGVEDRLEPIAWQVSPYLVFDRHRDIFGDQSAVLVPLPGHSFGSVGLILNQGAQKFFLVGDAVWAHEQVQSLEPKFWFASGLVDREPDALMQSLRKIRTLQDLGYVIVPTHDAGVQQQLGLYPHWIERQVSP